MYLRNQPSRRPTPAAIRNAAAAITNESKGSDKRANLSPMERQMLDDTVLPNARRSLSIPALAEHGRQTLEYWGESVSHAEDAKSVARYAADRISAGEAVSDAWLYGPIAVEIERSGLVGADIMRKYRSALYFSAKDLHGEETARDTERAWVARHEAAETPLHGVA